MKFSHHRAFLITNVARDLISVYILYFFQRRPKYKSNFLKYSSRGNLNNLSPPGSNRNSYCDQSPSSSGSAGMLSAITSKTTTHTAGISSASSSTLTAGSDHYRTAG